MLNADKKLSEKKLWDFFLHCMYMYLTMLETMKIWLKTQKQNNICNFCHVNEQKNKTLFSGSSL